MTDENFWLNTLLCSYKIFPSNLDSIDSNLNTLTRLIFLLSVLFWILKYKYTNLFLIISIIIIILIYVCNKKEYFDNKMSGYKFPLIGNNSIANAKISKYVRQDPRSNDSSVWSAPEPKYRTAIENNNLKYDVSDNYDLSASNFDNENDPPTRFQESTEYYTDFGLDRLGDVCKSNNITSRHLRNPRPQMAIINPKSDANDPQYVYYNRRENFDPNVDNSTSFVGTTPISNVVDSKTNTSGDVQTSNTTLVSTIIDSQQNTTPVSVVMNPISNENDSWNSNPHSEIKSQGGIQTPFLNQPTSKNLPQYDQSLLIPRSYQTIYGPNDEQDESDDLRHVPILDGNSYAYSDKTTPINSNLGISYTSRLPERVLEKVLTKEGERNLFRRVDAKDVGDRKDMQRRTDWNAKYADGEVLPDNLNYDGVYDPRQNGYGDSSRSFYDINAGNIKYYYSDIDSVYRNPLFNSQRSKVDFIDFTDETGRKIPEYTRKVGLNDVKKEVENQYMEDQLMHRESLMESALRKRSQEMWQQKRAPLSQSARTGYAFGQ